MLQKSKVVGKIAQGVVFLAIVILSDQLAGALLRHLYFHQKTGARQNFTYSLSDVKTDILIFGNSRAQHHYVPSIFSDSLKMSCFNAGQDGGHGVLLPYAQAQVIFERYTPKWVLLEFDPASVESLAADYDKLSILLPYERQYPALKPFILLRSRFERMKLISAIYPFNSLLINMIYFNTPFARKRDIEGYVPILDKEMNAASWNILLRKIERTTEPVRPPDPNELGALRKMIQLCRKKKIKLVLINSPVFCFQKDSSRYKKESVDEAMAILREEGAEFLDYTQDPSFAGHMDLFTNNVHLSNKGAKIFSSVLADKLKSYHD